MLKTPLLLTRRSLWYLLTFLAFSQTTGQVVVFSDDFSDNTDPNWTATGNLSGSSWTVYRSGVDWGARRNDSPIQLELSNDISGAANLGGYCLTSTPTTSFTSPYNPILQSGGVVTWTFNMRQIRDNPSGFTGTNYGVAFILAGETATDNASGNGYAVVLGQSGDIDPVRLVRYTTGLNSDADVTNLIVSNTAGLTDFGTEHLSIKVTYNPCNGGQWELFLRNDGSAFADPLSGSLTSQGTTLDNTYTGVVLGMMAAYWKGASSANQTAFFNNVTVSVIPTPSFTPGSNPVVCSGTTSANLTYSALAGSPDQYDIDWDAAAEAQGFVDVTSAALPASPISLTVPGAAAPGTYNGMMTLINTSTTCESDPYPISVTINPLPVVTCPAGDTLCSDEPAFVLTGGNPPGGVYSGTGVSGNMFDPAMAAPGVNIITYTYTDLNGCSNTCTFSITVNTAPVVDAGTYGPACLNGPDIVLLGSPPGGTWTGNGVTGNMFDPSFGTQTLTYTYFDMNGCGGGDQTTITVTSCALPSTMQWLLLDENQSNGSCTSNSDCDNNIICYGLEYTPLYTGNVTSYTTRWWAECFNGADPVLSNVSCTMTNNSNTIPGCAGFGLVIMNSSGNTGNLSVTAGIPVILHQVCFVIPNTGDIDVYPDTTISGAPPLTVSIDSVGGGGFEDDTILHKISLSIDSSLDCSILPLRWLSFTAAPVKAFVSGLEWVTAEEFNTAYFDIQRSNDGGHTFTTIGRVEAYGTNAEVHTYHFTDEQAWAGKNYYRLKQIDFDGRFQYSPVRGVTFEVDAFTCKVFPNPAHDHVNIQLYKAESAGDIQLTDLTGKTLLTRTFEPGIQSLRLPLPSLSSGLYHLAIRTGEHRMVEKLMITGTGQ